MTKSRNNRSAAIRRGKLLASADRPAHLVLLLDVPSEVEERQKALGGAAHDRHEGRPGHQLLQHAIRGVRRHVSKAYVERLALVAPGFKLAPREPAGGLGVQEVGASLVANLTARLAVERVPEQGGCCYLLSGFGIEQKGRVRRRDGASAKGVSGQFVPWIVLGDASRLHKSSGRQSTTQKQLWPKGTDAAVSSACAE